jgi:hypothetical protein
LAYEFQFNNYKINIDRTLDIAYTTFKKTKAGNLNTNQDIIDFSSLIEMWSGQDIAMTLYPSLSYSIFQDVCYKDMYFTNGEKMRSKISQKPFILNRKEFFENLEQMICCGIGSFVSSTGYQLRLADIKEFYTDTIGLIFDTSIDDIINIEIAAEDSMMINNIEIGYKDYKDTREELHQINKYNIVEQVKGSRLFSKITNFITSKYIIKRAINLGGQDKTLGYDNNVFIISAINNGSNPIHSLSQNSSPSSFGYDDTFETNETQPFGMNRKYASVYNLARHTIKWLSGAWLNKNSLDSESIYIKTIQTNIGCGLPSIIIDAIKSTTVPNISDKYIIPHIITIQVGLTSIDAWNTRGDWYNIVKIIDGTDEYQGYIQSHEHKDGISTFKLIGRKII